MITLILFLPLISGIICGLFSKFLSDKFAAYIASTALVISAILALKTLLYVQIEHKILHNIIATWINLGSFAVHWAIYVDQLTAVMFVVVTLVSSVVHIYSYGYMHDDENLPRFMSYLSFFTFIFLLDSGIKKTQLIQLL